MFNKIKALISVQLFYKIKAKTMKLEVKLQHAY